MKILFVPDVNDWAIGHLVQAKVRYMPYHTCKVYAVHPRDAIEKADEFLEYVKQFNPDVIVYEYFRSCEQLINAKPELKEWKSVLVHHNQKDKALKHADWNALGIDTIVTHTTKCRDKLVALGYSNVTVINHGIDLDFFSYAETEPLQPCIGYVGRVVPWKGLKEVAEVAQELGYKVLMMGKIDKVDYWEQVPKEPLMFDFMDCSDDERVEAYRNMTVYVGNSEDDYEEGTLPFLEAMACGTPIVTTLSGVAKDIIKDGHNALVVPFKDKAALKEKIQLLMGDEELRTKLRRAAWDTVKNMPEAKMAYEYSKLLWSIHSQEPLVSVIIPATIDRFEQVKHILSSLENQSYKPIEAVVVFDETEQALNEKELPFEALSERLRMAHPTLTIKVLITNSEGYNLAMARNLGAIEAEGKYLMFNDSRLNPDINAVKMFMTAMDNVEDGSYWFFGDKGSQKASFVENFSFIGRNDFMRFGMFCERITQYGGMSQETRTRWIKQKGQLSYLESAKAKELIKSKLTANKRQGIIKMKLQLLKMYGGDSH